MIELLIVIAVIAILASMLLPALRKAKSLALRINCSGNIRLQGLAVHNYAGDYDGVIPNKCGLQTGWTWKHINMDRWDGTFGELVGQDYLTPDARICPASYYSRNRGYVYGEASYKNLRVHPDQNGTYYYFGGGMESADSWVAYKPDLKMDIRLRLDFLKTPSIYTLSGDWYASPTSARRVGDWDNYRLSNHDSWQAPTGMNTLFADNHVSWADSNHITTAEPVKSIHNPVDANYIYAYNYFVLGGKRYHWNTPEYQQFKQIVRLP